MLVKLSMREAQRLNIARTSILSTQVFAKYSTIPSTPECRSQSPASDITPPSFNPQHTRDSPPITILALWQRLVDSKHV